MKRLSIGLSSIIAVLCMTSIVLGSETARWGYTGQEGPEHWGKLDPKYALCSEGKNQSPVNLTGMIESELPPITVNYKSGGNEILNNGHSIQVNYKPGSTIKVNGNEFKLQQFHFHSPSENTIEGRSFPMEAHFVHADEEGNLARNVIRYSDQSCIYPIGSCRLSLCCDPISEERSAGNPHATFCGNRRWATASGDPVLGVKFLRATRLTGFV